MQPSAHWCVRVVARASWLACGGCLGSPALTLLLAGTATPGRGTSPNGLDQCPSHGRSKIFRVPIPPGTHLRSPQGHCSPSTAWVWRAALSWTPALEGGRGQTPGGFGATGGGAYVVGRVGEDKEAPAMGRGGLGVGCFCNYRTSGDNVHSSLDPVLPARLCAGTLRAVPCSRHPRPHRNDDDGDIRG